MPYQKLQAGRAAVVTPSDTTDIPYVGGGTGEWPCVLYVGDVASGTRLKVRTAGGDDVTFTGIVAGSFIPVQVIRVCSTGTDVDDIIALW
jgi:hypothetical protein